MVAVVDVKIKGGFTEVRNYLNKLPRIAEKIGNLEAWNLTQFGAKSLIQSALNAGIKPWRNKLLKYGMGIEPRKLGKNRYGIFIPYYGIYLDQMAPHFVSLKRGRLISQWAKDKGIKAKAIKVRPHPFIDSGYRKMLNRLEITANRIGNRIVK